MAEIQIPIKTLQEFFNSLPILNPYDNQKEYFLKVWIMEKDGQIVLPDISKTYISIEHEYSGYTCLGILECRWNPDNKEWNLVNKYLTN